MSKAVATKVHSHISLQRQKGGSRRQRTKRMHGLATTNPRSTVYLLDPNAFAVS